MAELNPQPDFASPDGISFTSHAGVTGGQLAFSSGGINPPNASWTSPETITEGYYRYDVTVDETSGAGDQCIALCVAGKTALLYGAGRFEGAFWTHMPANQLISIRPNDSDIAAKLSHCSINRE